MSLSDYAEKAILDHVFGPTPMTAPAARYVSLHTADPGESGASESSLARQAATFAAASLGAGTTQNTGAVVFTNGGGGSVAATHFGVWDSLSGGNFLGGNALTASKTLAPTDTGTFAAGALTISIS